LIILGFAKLEIPDNPVLSQTHNSQVSVFVLFSSNLFNSQFWKANNLFSTSKIFSTLHDQISQIDFVHFLVEILSFVILIFLKFVASKESKSVGLSA